MKITFGKKLLLFLHWLISLIICINAVLKFVFPDIMQQVVDFGTKYVGSRGCTIIGIALIALYVVSVITVAGIIFSNKEKKNERGFIVVDSSDSGKTRIAIAAVEQMIHQASSGIEGVAEMKSAIENNSDAISIKTNVSLLEGAHVPTVTMNIQRAIRSYIELNCGVAVREVCVSVHSVNAGEEKSKKKLGRKSTYEAPHTAVAAPVPVAPAEEPAEEPTPEIRVSEEPVIPHEDEPIRLVMGEGAEEPAAETEE